MNFISTANRPDLADPVDNSSKPVGWDTTDAANLTSVASFVFGSGSTNGMGQATNITSRAVMDRHVEYNQIFGQAGSNINGSAAQNTSSFTSEFRSYPAGDVHDTTVIQSDGLHLKAFCAGNGGTTCTGQANVVTGIVRPETAIKPGMIAETCRMVPGSSFTAAWPTNWFRDGQRAFAGDTTSTYYGSGGGLPYTAYAYLEIDAPDHYPQSDGVAANRSLTGASTPMIDSHYVYGGAPVNVTKAQDEALQGNYQVVFAANSGGFTRKAGSPEFGFDVTIDLSAAPHCYQIEFVDAVFSDPSARMNVTTPGHIIYSLDGVEYLDQIYNFGSVNKSWNGAGAALTGANLIPSLSNMVALQYGPYRFDPNATAAMTPATVNNAVDVVYSIRYWQRTGGAHVAPTLVNAGG